MFSLICTFLWTIRTIAAINCSACPCLNFYFQNIFFLEFVQFWLILTTPTLNHLAYSDHYFFLNSKLNPFYYFFILFFIFSPPLLSAFSWTDLKHSNFFCSTCFAHSSALRNIPHNFIQPPHGISPETAFSYAVIALIMNWLTHENRLSDSWANLGNVAALGKELWTYA